MCFNGASMVHPLKWEGTWRVSSRHMEPNHWNSWEWLEKDTKIHLGSNVTCCFSILTKRFSHSSVRYWGVNIFYIFWISGFVVNTPRLPDDVVKLSVSPRRSKNFHTFGHTVIYQKQLLTLFVTPSSTENTINTFPQESVIFILFKRGLRFVTEQPNFSEFHYSKITHVL